MTRLPLDLYCASAGSGKTYTLSKKYIVLLLYKRLVEHNHTPSLHRHTLAVTFTNKATTEMKERIINDLFQLSRGEHIDLCKDILAEFSQLGVSVQREQVMQQSGILLREILHDYSNFSVSTIDMFFQKLVRGFLKEIGIQPDFKLEINDNQLIQQAIDLLLERITQSQVREHTALQTYIREMLESGRWNLRLRLTNNARQVLEREYRTNYLRDEDQFSTLEHFHQQIEKKRDEWKAELKALGETCRTIIDKKGILETDFKNGSKGTLYKFMMTVSDTSYRYEFDKKYLKMGLEAGNPTECGSKKTSIGYRESFMEFQALSVRAKDLCLLLIENEVFFENLNLLKIFHLIGSNILSLQEEQNMRRLSDAQDLIEHIIHQNSIPFLYEKAGIRLHHLLLDEFQDTSAGQWNCLSPLLEEAVSSDNSCLIVGDVKQSIYRWREGDWRILGETVPRSFGNYVNENVLKKNWRSCAQIVEFNNHVFEHLPALLALQNQTIKNNIFEHVYKDVIQQVKDPDSGGYIEVHFSEEVDYALTQLGPCIHQALQRGYACSDIAVLVRDKKNARAAADAILEYQALHPEISLEIISQESLTIEASVTAQWMLAMFRLAQLPQTDRHNPNHIHYQEALVALQQIKPDENWENTPIISIADEINQKGVLWGFETMTLWINRLTPDQSPAEAAFIQAFHNLANQFCQEGNPSIRSFLEWWDLDKNHYIQTPPGKDAISIMTIHKSKGLEFPIVIIPSCDFSFKKLSSSKIWAYPESISPTHLQSYQQMGLFIPKTPLLLNWNNRLKESIYAQRYAEEQALDSLETLNLFYVALTRAKCELYLWSHVGASAKSPDTAEHLGVCFYTYFLNQTKWPLVSDKNNALHQFCCIGTHTKKMTNTAEQKPDLSPFRYTSYPRNIALKVHPYANRHPQPDELFESPRTYGILMHRILECIEQPGELMSLLEDERFFDVPRSDLKICLQKIGKAFENPIARQWFSSDWELYKEAEILLPMENGIGQSLRPDRVMIKGNNVVIVDYKFGKKALLNESKHKTQIRQYCDLIRVMEPQKMEIKLYLWYIDNDCILEVH